MQVSCNEALESDLDSYVLHKSGKQSVGTALRHSMEVNTMLWEDYFDWASILRDHEGPHDMHT